jgi:hypothetical protein
MNRRTLFAVRLALMAVILGAWWYWFATSSPPATQDTPRERAVLESGKSQPELSTPDREVIQGGHPLAAGLNAREGTPQRDLEILREVLLAFTTTLKAQNLPPLGDNIDVTAALTGKNPRNLVVLPANHPSIDSKGRLLDRWGTPYHFHARSADTFDLRSAGPDKLLFTPDDVTDERGKR